MRFLSAFLFGAVIIAAMWLQISEAQPDVGSFCPLGFERGEIGAFLRKLSDIFHNFDKISFNRC